LLGLVLRELLENSATHGYGGGSGKIEVRFLRDGNEAVFSVRDFGAGIPTARREGLGLRIIDALARQLSGSLIFQDAAPGASATIRFPLT